MPSLRPASARGIGLAVGVLGAWLPVAVDHRSMKPRPKQAVRLPVEVLQYDHGGRAGGGRSRG
jgi:hypothetical protein